MKNFTRKMALQKKLMGLFLIVGVTPFAIVSAVAYWNSSTALDAQAKNQLVTARDIKKSQIEGYLTETQVGVATLANTVRTLRDESIKKMVAVRDLKKVQIEEYLNVALREMETFARSEDTLHLYGKLREYHEATHVTADGAYDVTTPEYKEIAEELGRNVELYQEETGFGDVYMACTAHGHVMYSVSEKPDLGSNLRHGPFKDSGLRELLEKIVTTKSTALVDFAPYAANDNKPAAFAGAPIIDKEGEMIGMMAVRIKLDDINRIMKARSGMGETGETYLVGQDQLMRSDSFLDPDNHSVAASFKDPSKGSVNTVASKAACNGETGAEVVLDYNGNPVVSAWTPVTVAGLTWGVLAEIDVAEAFCPKIEGDEKDYYGNYMEQAGLYDVFLMTPNGYCFYTVCQEADYQTNLISGKFATSNLGELARKVVRTKEFGVADFAPYAPSDGVPAAFAATPVLYEGNVELVVAVQLSLATINGIMQQRAGMGESGETYLVGSDNLMRSDSFLDKEGHSVTSSFAGTIQANGVDTDATTAAFSGETGVEAILDYNGNPVLSAFTPVAVGDTNWVLIAEIDQSEAFAAINSLTWIICVIGVVGVIAILLVGFTSARSIAKPIKRIIDDLRAGAEQTTSAAGQVSSASQSLAQGASEQAASLEETTSSIEEMSSMTKQNAGNAVEAKSLSEVAWNNAERGSKAMERMSTAILDIKKSSDETAQIVKTIDEIAFQTNLLALNAAVEAARAGEAGKGFAVVAEEVRNLAQRSAEAARTTSDMIASSVKNADNGVGISKEVADSLGEISEGSRKVNDLVGEIAAASNEQSQGIDQINTAVSQMDQVTQSNAASAEESASAAEELSAQSEELKDMVRDLINVVDGVTSQECTAVSASSTPARATSGGSSWTASTAPAPTVRPAGSNGHAKRAAAAPVAEEEFPMNSEEELATF